MGELYDRIGEGYGRLRRPDPRIAAAIAAGLGDAASVLNVGAGAGSYEPLDRRVVALEPSLTMIRQRPVGAPPAVRGTAVALPFRDGAFDATLATLTIHHWPDPDRGIAEMRRVARRRVVILTWDADGPGFWLMDYFPEIAAIDRRMFSPLDHLRRVLGATAVSSVPIPHDCVDGFLGAYWRRPHAYLDAAVRSAISTFAKIEHLDDGLARLRRDLESGAWHRRYGECLSRPELDLGYRLVTASL